MGRCEVWVHWSHLCTCSLMHLPSLNYNPWAGDLCRGFSLHWMLHRTSCYSLFSYRKVLGSLSKQNCHLAKLMEVSVLCEILVVTKIA